MVFLSEQFEFILGLSQPEAGGILLDGGQVSRYEPPHDEDDEDRNDEGLYGLGDQDVADFLQQIVIQVLQRGDDGQMTEGVVLAVFTVFQRYAFDPIVLLRPAAASQQWLAVLVGDFQEYDVLVLQDAVEHQPDGVEVQHPQILFQRLLGGPSDLFYLPFDAGDAMAVIEIKLKRGEEQRDRGAERQYIEDGSAREFAFEQKEQIFHGVMHRVPSAPGALVARWRWAGTPGLIFPAVCSDDLPWSSGICR